MRFIVENSSSNYKDEILDVINNRKKEIFDFFNSDVIDLTFDVYIYNSLESLVEGLRKRGFSKDPDYMCACFKDRDNSINFFEPKDNPGENEWSKEEYKNVIFHELVHAVQYSLFGSCPEWLCEGIAKYLDGSYSKGIKWLLDNYINMEPIPNQSEIENEFGMHDYDSYDYAYLMVRYLIEINGKDSFIDMVKNHSIDTVGLLNKAIEYYNYKYFGSYLDKYLNQNIDNPKYLFHGSPKRLFKLVPKLSHDSDGNVDNIAEAVFLFPSFLKSTPYAFKDTIKSNSMDLNWDFNIPNGDEFPLMKMSNVNIDEDIIGYIYVFENSDDMIRDNDSYQYKCYKELVPIDVVEVCYKDYKKYYDVVNKVR